MMENRSTVQLDNWIIKAKGHLQAGPLARSDEMVPEFSDVGGHAAWPGVPLMRAMVENRRGRNIITRMPRSCHIWSMIRCSNWEVKGSKGAADVPAPMISSGPGV